MEYDFEDPNFDFAGNAEIIAAKLRRAREMQNAEAPQGIRAGNVFAMSQPDIGGAIQRGVGRYEQAQAEQARGSMNTEQLRRYDELSRGLNEMKPIDYSNPDEAVVENSRRQALAGQMSKLNLPQAQKAAEIYLNKGAAFPETIAKMKMEQVERGEQNALRLREIEAQKERDAAAALERDRLRAQDKKDLMAFGASIKGAGSGPRDRFSIQTGPDNQMYRVNLETGQADPVSIRSALPNAVSTQQPGIGLQKPKAPPTEAERTAAGYLGRMEATEKALGKLQGGEATELTAAAGALPLVGPYAQRKVETLPQSQYRQYADDWIRAKLRKESGAVIGKEEMDKEYITYFPQPGERPEVAAQKAQARLQAQEQLRSSAGQVKPTQAPARNMTYADPAKQARYEAWKKAQGL